MNLTSIWNIYPPAFTTWLASLPKTRPAAVADRPAGRDRYAGLHAQNANGVLVVNVHGVLLKSAGWLENYGAVSTDKLTHAVRQGMADPAIHSVLLHIDSPGGSVDGLSELGDAVYEARFTKPVHAYVDGLGASAGYYLASQADKITAERTALVGSIGVRMVVYDFSRAFEMDGIRPVIVDTGEYKSTGVLGSHVTDNQEADLHRVVDSYYDDFIAAVVRGRGVSPATVRGVWGDGRVHLAPAARAMGLIDTLGTASEAYDRLRVKGMAAAGESNRRYREARTKVMKMAADAALWKSRGRVP